MAAKRTPFGRMGGALKDVHPSDLLAVAAKDALKAGNIAPSIINTANIGQVNNVSICRKKFIFIVYRCVFFKFTQLTIKLNSQPKDQWFKNWLFIFMYLLNNIFKKYFLYNNSRTRSIYDIVFL